MEVSGIAGQMQAVCHTANVGIMLRAPDAGAACIHNTDGNAQPAPDFIHRAHKFLCGLNRKTAAIRSAALAAEFLPGKKFDFIPEGAGIGEIHLFRYIQRLPGDKPGKGGIPGIVAEETIFRNPQTALQLPGGSFRLSAPDAVHILRLQQVKAA